MVSVRESENIKKEPPMKKPLPIGIEFFDKSCKWDIIGLQMVIIYSYPSAKMVNIGIYRKVGTSWKTYLTTLNNRVLAQNYITEKLAVPDLKKMVISIFVLRQYCICLHPWLNKKLLQAHYMRLIFPYMIHYIFPALILWDALLSSRKHSYIITLHLKLYSLLLRQCFSLIYFIHTLNIKQRGQEYYNWNPSRSAPAENSN